MAKVREVMADHAARMIGEGQRDFLVAGLREVEQAMSAGGERRSFLPHGDEAHLTDQQVAEAFADFGAEYLGEKNGKSGISRAVDGKIHGTKLGAVLDAVTRVIDEALRPLGRSANTSLSAGRASSRDVSTGASSEDSASRERTMADRHTERTQLHEGIPKDRDWISRMFKLNPKSAHHELVRKAATLIDLVLDVDYSHSRFDQLNKFKELLYNDTENSTPTIPGTPDHGYYHQPNKGPGEFHVWEGSQHRLVTSLHEIGHHLGKMLGLAAENNVLNAHKGTRRHKTILDKLTPEDAEYYNRGEEVFARAFAQLIAERIGHRDPELSREFEKMSKDDKEQYKAWRPADFAGVRDALVKELEDAQWTLRPTM